MRWLRRLLFRLTARPGAVLAAALPFLALRAVAGELTALRALGKASRYYRRWLLGWPYGVPMVFNIELSRFWRRLERRVLGRAPVAQRPPGEVAGRRLRVGCLGAFSELYSAPAHLLAAAPEEVELHVFDTPYKKRPFVPAGFLRPLVHDYRVLDWQQEVLPLDSYRDSLRRAAAAVNEADLDLLALFFNVPPLFDLLDWIETPSVAEICIISDLIHHPNVSFHVCPQLGPDYRFEGGRLASELTGRTLDGAPVVPGFLFYDRRDLDFSTPRPWRKRDGLVVFHGLLYKAAAEPFLDCLARLLADDPALRFAFAGRDIDGSLERMTAFFRRRGLAGQVHYRGTFSARREAGDVVTDPGWGRLVEDLERARLAPDPWPVGGASSRFEGYLCGTPSVHMGIDHQRARGGGREHSLIEVPDLLVPPATAYDPGGYLELCRRCLYDEEFAGRLQELQLAVARRVGDADAWWRQLLDYHAAWLAGELGG